MLRAAKNAPLKMTKSKSKLGGQKLDEVATTAGVAPLVVVPGQNFDTALSDNFGAFSIDDGRIRIALEVGGDELFFGVAEYAFHWAVGGGFQSSVDGILVGTLVHEDGQVDDADVGGGDAHGGAGALARSSCHNPVQ